MFLSCESLTDVRSIVARIKGFTTIELTIALAILAILAAVGIPNFMAWMSNSRRNAAPEFYLDGLRRAREGAIKYNAASRLVLTVNTNNGQYDWQIDWCSPIGGTPCNATSGNWSTPGSPVATPAQIRLGQPPGPSVFRSAGALPASSLVTTTTQDGNVSVYFNSLGWLNGTVEDNMRWMRFTPYDTQTPPSQISITLAGVADRCDPSAAPTDSRGCPP